MRIESQRSHPPTGDSDRLAGWRRERLLSAGFPPDLADRLARERSTDVHALLDLVDRRCPPALAARILAPIDAEPSRW